METVAPESADTPVVQHGTSQVIYNGKNISAAISPYLLEVQYVDQIGGEADSVEITLENAGHRWENDWYPGFGDELTVSIGYADAPLLPCGKFEIDEVDLEGPPDTVRLKALGAGVKRALRTKRGRAYENTTLAAIAATVARHNKLALKGRIEKISIARVTQAFETDLAFLKRISVEHGYDFSVRGGAITFYKRADLKGSKGVMTLMRGDVSRYHFHDKVHEIYTACTVSYHHAKHKKTHKKRIVDPSKGLSKYDHYSADELNVNVRAENDGQAQTKASAALERANDDQTMMEMTLYGNTKLAAGINILVQGFGKVDGKYTITKSTHKISRSSGYTTDIELKRVRESGQGA